MAHNRPRVQRSESGTKEIPTVAQFSPTGGNEAVKNVGMPSPPATPSPSAPSPAERVGAESEEIPTVAQFSPTGGNGAVVGISELERVMGVEPTYQPWEGRILPMNYTRAMSIL